MSKFIAGFSLISIIAITIIGLFFTSDSSFGSYEYLPYFSNYIVHATSGFILYVVFALAFVALIVAAFILIGEGRKEMTKKKAEQI